MSEELTIERIRELRAGVTPADHSPLHHCTPLFMGEVVDFLLTKLDEMREAQRKLIFNARQVACTVKGMDSIIHPLQRSIDECEALAQRKP